MSSDPPLRPHNTRPPDNSNVSNASRSQIPAAALSQVLHGRKIQIPAHMVQNVRIVGPNKVVIQTKAANVATMQHTASPKPAVTEGNREETSNKDAAVKDIFLTRISPCILPEIWSKSKSSIVVLGQRTILNMQKKVNLSNPQPLFDISRICYAHTPLLSPSMLSYLARTETDFSSFQSLNCTSKDQMQKVVMNLLDSNAVADELKKMSFNDEIICSRPPFIRNIALLPVYSLVDNGSVQYTSEASPSKSHCAFKLNNLESMDDPKNPNLCKIVGSVSFSWLYYLVQQSFVNQPVPAQGSSSEPSSGPVALPPTNTWMGIRDLSRYMSVVDRTAVAAHSQEFARDHSYVYLAVRQVNAKSAQKTKINNAQAKRKADSSVSNECLALKDAFLQKESWGAIDAPPVVNILESGDGNECNNMFPHGHEGFSKDQLVILGKLFNSATFRNKCLEDVTSQPTLPLEKLVDHAAEMFVSTLNNLLGLVGPTAFSCLRLTAGDKERPVATQEDPSINIYPFSLEAEKNKTVDVFAFILNEIPSSIVQYPGIKEGPLACATIGLQLPQPLKCGGDCAIAKSDIARESIVCPKCSVQTVVVPPSVTNSQTLHCHLPAISSLSDAYSITPISYSRLRLPPGVPEKPERLVTSKSSASTLRIKWDATDAQMYELHFRFKREVFESNTDTTEILETDLCDVWIPVYCGPESQFDMQNLPPGSPFEFRVRGKNGEGYSLWSDILIARTATTVPQNYKSLKIRDLAPTSLKLDWSDAIALPSSEKCIDCTDATKQARSDASDFHLCQCVRNRCSEWVRGTLHQPDLDHFLQYLSNHTGFASELASQSFTTAKAADVQLPIQKSSPGQPEKTSKNNKNRAKLKPSTSSAHTPVVEASSSDASSTAPLFLQSRALTSSGSHQAVAKTATQWIVSILNTMDAFEKKAIEGGTRTLEYVLEAAVGKPSDDYTMYKSAEDFSKQAEMDPTSVSVVDLANAKSILSRFSKRPMHNLEFFTIYKGLLSSFRYENLTPLAHYSFRLSIRNQSGQSLHSVMQTIQLPDLPPVPPTAIYFTNAKSKAESARTFGISEHVKGLPNDDQSFNHCSTPMMKATGKTVRPWNDHPLRKTSVNGYTGLVSALTNASVVPTGSIKVSWRPQSSTVPATSLMHTNVHSSRYKSSQDANASEIYRVMYAPIALHDRETEVELVEKKGNTWHIVEKVLSQTREIANADKSIKSKSLKNVKSSTPNPTIIASSELQAIPHEYPLAYQLLSSWNVQEIRDTREALIENLQPRQCYILLIQSSNKSGIFSPFVGALFVTLEDAPDVPSISLTTLQPPVPLHSILHSSLTSLGTNIPPLPDTGSILYALQPASLVATAPVTDTTAPLQRVDVQVRYFGTTSNRQHEFPCYQTSPMCVYHPLQLLRKQLLQWFLKLVIAWKTSLHRDEYDDPSKTALLPWIPNISNPEVFTYVHQFPESLHDKLVEHYADHLLGNTLHQLSFPSSAHDQLDDNPAHATSPITMTETMEHAYVSAFKERYSWNYGDYCDVLLEDDNLWYRGTILHIALSHSPFSANLDYPTYTLPMIDQFSMHSRREEVELYVCVSVSLSLGMEVKVFDLAKLRRQFNTGDIIKTSLAHNVQMALGVERNEFMGKVLGATEHGYQVSLQFPKKYLERLQMGTEPEKPTVALALAAKPNHPIRKRTGMQHRSSSAAETPLQSDDADALVESVLELAASRVETVQPVETAASSGAENLDKKGSWLKAALRNKPITTVFTTWRSGADGNSPYTTVKSDSQSGAGAINLSSSGSKQAGPGALKSSSAVPAADSKLLLNSNMRRLFTLHGVSGEPEKDTMDMISTFLSTLPSGTYQTLSMLLAEPSLPNWYAALASFHVQDAFTTSTYGSNTSQPLTGLNPGFSRTFLNETNDANGSPSFKDLGSFYATAGQMQSSPLSLPFSLPLSTNLGGINKAPSSVMLHIPPVFLLGQSYELRVRWVNSVGSGDWSSPVLIRTDTPPPLPPITLSIASESIFDVQSIDSSPGDDPNASDQNSRPNLSYFTNNYPYLPVSADSSSIHLECTLPVSSVPSAFVKSGLQSLTSPAGLFQSNQEASCGSIVVEFCGVSNQSLAHFAKLFSPLYDQLAQSSSQKNTLQRKGAKHQIGGDLGVNFSHDFETLLEKNFTFQVCPKEMYSLGPVHLMDGDSDQTEDVQDGIPNVHQWEKDQRCKITLQLRNLDPHTLYAVRIRSVYSEGVSLPSSPVLFVSRPASLINGKLSAAVRSSSELQTSTSVQEDTGASRSAPYGTVASILQRLALHPYLQAAQTESISLRSSLQQHYPYAEWNLMDSNCQRENGKGIDKASNLTNSEQNATVLRSKNASSIPLHQSFTSLGLLNTSPIEYQFGLSFATNTKNDTQNSSLTQIPDLHSFSSSYCATFIEWANACLSGTQLTDQDSRRLVSLQLATHFVAHTLNKVALQEPLLLSANSTNSDATFPLESFALVFSSKRPTFRIFGLLPSGRYAVVFRIRNVFGWSSWSRPVVVGAPGLNARLPPPVLIQDAEAATYLVLNSVHDKSTCANSTSTSLAPRYKPNLPANKGTTCTLSVERIILHEKLLHLFEEFFTIVSNLSYEPFAWFHTAYSTFNSSIERQSNQVFNPFETLVRSIALTIQSRIKESQQPFSWFNIVQRALCLEFGIGIEFIDTTEPFEKVAQQLHKIISALAQILELSPDGLSIESVCMVTMLAVRMCTEVLNYNWPLMQFNNGISEQHEALSFSFMDCLQECYTITPTYRGNKQCSCQKERYTMNLDESTPASVTRLLEKSVLYSSLLHICRLCSEATDGSDANSAQSPVVNSIVAHIFSLSLSLFSALPHKNISISIGSTTMPLGKTLSKTSKANFQDVMRIALSVQEALPSFIQSYPLGSFHDRSGSESFSAFEHQYSLDPMYTSAGSSQLTHCDMDTSNLLVMPVKLTPFLPVAYRMRQMDSSSNANEKNWIFGVGHHMLPDAYASTDTRKESITIVHGGSVGKEAQDVINESPEPRADDDQKVSEPIRKRTTLMQPKSDNTKPIGKTSKISKELDKRQSDPNDMQEVSAQIPKDDPLAECPQDAPSIDAISARGSLKKRKQKGKKAKTYDGAESTDHSITVVADSTEFDVAEDATVPLEAINKAPTMTAEERLAFLQSRIARGGTNIRKPKTNKKTEAIATFPILVMLKAFASTTRECIIKNKAILNIVVTILLVLASWAAAVYIYVRNS